MTTNSRHLTNLGIYIKTLRDGRYDASNLHIVHKLMRRDWVISAHISTCSWHICVTRNVHQHLLCNTQTTSVSGLLQRSGSTQHLCHKDGISAPCPSCPPGITPNTHNNFIQSTTAKHNVFWCQQHIHRLKNVSFN